MAQPGRRRGLLPPFFLRLVLGQPQSTREFNGSVEVQDHVWNPVLEKQGLSYTGSDNSMFNVCRSLKNVHVLQYIYFQNVIIF